MYHLLALISLLNLLAKCTFGIDIHCDAVSRRGLCLPSNYSKYDLPFKDRVNKVGVGIHLNEILSVDVKEYSITMAIYMDIRWLDPRIVLGKEMMSQAQGEESWIPHQVEILDQLWVPDIYVYNVCCKVKIIQQNIIFRLLGKILYNVHEQKHSFSIKLWFLLSSK